MIRRKLVLISIADVLCDLLGNNITFECRPEFLFFVCFLFVGWLGVFFGGGGCCCCWRFFFFFFDCLFGWVFLVRYLPSWD